MLGRSVSSKNLNRFLSDSYKPNSERANEIDGFILDKSLSSKRAAVYHNPETNQTYVANRGTAATASDWLNNYRYVTGSYDDTDRFRHAVDTQKQAISKYGKVDANLTHSQSGIIGRKLNEKGLTGQVIQINPALMFENQKKNETIIRSSNDPVSMLARFNPSLNIETIKSTSINPLTEHSSDVLLRTDQTFGEGLEVGLDNITTDSELNDMLSQVEGFRGCFVADAIPSEPGFYCVNLNGKSHWCGLLRAGKKSEYFDAFGFPPPTSIKLPYTWSDAELQWINSSACGYYVVAWIKWRASGKSYESFLMQFYNDPEKNEKRLADLLHHL